METATSIAAAPVLKVPELLEAILFRLPIRNLLLAQRVSRKWRDTISSSPLLQQALFFRPETGLSPNPVYQFNELLAEVFSPWFFQTNPQARGFSGGTFDNMPWSGSSAAVLCEEASWRRMLVCQPPLQIIVREITKRRGGTSSREGRAKDHTSLRMGTLYDLTHGWVFGHAVASFGVEWFCYWRPSRLGIETDDEKRAVYDKYMGEGILLGQLPEPREEFSPRAEVRLNLSYVVQCNMFPRLDWERREKLKSQAAREVELVYGEYMQLARDAEYDSYVARKMQEHLSRLYPG